MRIFANMHMKAMEASARAVCGLLRLLANEHRLLVLCQLVQVYMYEPGRVRGLSDHPRLTQFLWQMEVVEE